MVKEKYILFFFLGGVLLNVMVLACLILMGQRQDGGRRIMVYDAVQPGCDDATDP